MDTDNFYESVFLLNIPTVHANPAYLAFYMNTASIIKFPYPHKIVNVNQKHEAGTA
jgi:hypothetical protein